MSLTATARRCGLYSAAAVAALQLAYAGTLAFGLLTLASPDEPISGPAFVILEVLILLMMPAIVLLMSAIHAAAPERVRPLTLAALVFASLLAGITCMVHFAILTVGHHPAVASQPWLLSFRWPSLAYALDILAWDFFFPLAMLCAAPAFPRSAIGRLMVASAILALAGLSGAATGNMQLRNIGIIGYLVVFFAVVLLLGLWFRRGDAENP